jgi:sugar/nucleoside kinase (ribokinase family)
MFDIVTIGGATRDITFITDKGRVVKTPENLTEQSLLAFEYGAKIRSDEVYFNFGGGACNTAATFAKLGLRTVVNCKVGKDDSGKCILSNLKNIGVDTSLVQIDKDAKTGFSLVVVNKKNKGGDRVIFVYKGASDFLEIRKKNLTGAKWIYLTSLAGYWEKSLDEISKAVEENRIRLAWNPGATQISAGKNKLEKFLNNAEIFIVNKDEAIELVQSDKNLNLDFNQINDSAVLARSIKSWGPKIVVITDGPEGAYVCDGENVLYSPATSRDKIDSTGAGDAFGSAFVGGYILNNNIEIALKHGIINSGNVVSEYGAQNGILSEDEIVKRLDSVEVSYL